jgi:hypothetical protein
MAAPGEFVAYGGLIYLDDEAGRCVCSSGLGTSAEDAVVSTRALADLHLRQDFAAKAAFVVEAPGTWTALHAYKEACERLGLSLLDAQTTPETRAAYKKCEREIERNAQENSSATSKVLRFGMVVQLLHHASGKYLASSQKQAAVSGRGHRVTLDAHAGNAGLFRVMASLRVHSEGERYVRARSRAIVASAPFPLPLLHLLRELCQA